MVGLVAIHPVKADKDDGSDHNARDQDQQRAIDPGRDRDGMIETLEVMRIGAFGALIFEIGNEPELRAPDGADNITDVEGQPTQRRDDGFILLAFFFGMLDGVLDNALKVAGALAVAGRRSGRGDKSHPRGL
jgi:hypothetical protein